MAWNDVSIKWIFLTWLCSKLQVIFFEGSPTFDLYQNPSGGFLIYFRRCKRSPKVVLSVVPSHALCISSVFLYFLRWGKSKQFYLEGSQHPGSSTEYTEQQPLSGPRRGTMRSSGLLWADTALLQLHLTAQLAPFKNRDS